MVELSASVEFLVVGGAPSILSHLLGCLFLALYYSCSHTWREMGKEREEGRCGFLSRICSQQDPVVAENATWEQVAAVSQLPFSFFSLQVELQELDQVVLQEVEALDGRETCTQCQVNTQRTLFFKNLLQRGQENAPELNTSMPIKDGSGECLHLPVQVTRY